ncbi:hypothetical protein [Streptomyces sp. NBC_01187]|uniref:hypothetical protein n=1 Tax=Streptomyces sp. NBC_01187 TaxID=2903766 RepID=UPI003869FED0|nr:hypothetical protein OG220_11745 [Streptomyces sp. NBC_01187]
MNDYTDSHITSLAQQRETLDRERRRIEKAYALAVLDHTAAYLRAVCPEAVYVEFAYYGNTRALDLHEVLGAQPTSLGTCTFLWDGTEDDHPLTELSDNIEMDLQIALEPYDSPAWATVNRNSASDGNSWLLELPPPDRAARIAELVRAFHPEATGVVVDGHAAGGRVLEIVEDIKGATNFTTKRRWTRGHDEVITRLVAQVFALPALAQRHLVHLQGYRHPYGSRTTDLVRLMPLPPTS